MSDGEWQLMRGKMETKKPDFRMKIRLFDFLRFSVWCHLELNQGHTDFQSVALPTELWHRCFLTRCKTNQNLFPSKHQPKKNEIKMNLIDKSRHHGFCSGLAIF